MTYIKLLLLSCTLLSVSCIGLAHSRAPCCSDVKGKYYRATRVDFDLMAKKPLLSPIPLILDLPFALVIETLEIPFIATGLHDPRPQIIVMPPEEIVTEEQSKEGKDNNEKP